MYSSTASVRFSKSLVCFLGALMLVASITFSYTENNYAFLKAFFMDGKKVHKGNIFVGGKDVYKLLE